MYNVKWPKQSLYLQRGLWCWGVSDAVDRENPLTGPVETDVRQNKQRQRWASFIWVTR